MIFPRMKKNSCLWTAKQAAEPSPQFPGPRSCPQHPRGGVQPPPPLLAGGVCTPGRRRRSPSAGPHRSPTGPSRAGGTDPGSHLACECTRGPPRRGAGRSGLETARTRFSLGLPRSRSGGAAAASEEQAPVLAASPPAPPPCTIRPGAASRRFRVAPASWRGPRGADLLPRTPPPLPRPANAR